MEGVACGVTADAARKVAACRDRGHEGSVPHRQKAHVGPRGRICGLRHGRGARGRADFPLHLRGGGVPQAGSPLVDFVAHPRRDQGRASGDEGRPLVRLTGGGGPRPCPGGLAGRNESVACVHDHTGRYLLRRQGADADIGDARRTRKGDPRVRPRDVLRSPRHVRRHALHGHLVQARRGPIQRVQAAPARRTERAGHRRPCEARRPRDYRVHDAGQSADAASAALRSHRAAAACQPSLGVQCDADARSRAGLI